MAVTAGKIAKYTLLPGYWPRVKDLVTSGFGYVAFLMAVIYNSVRLLPPSHPYLNPANMGRFGMRHVIAEAANNLVFSRKNWDQMLLFFTLLTGVVLLVLQFILLIVSFIPAEAFAAGPFTPFFGTNIDPAQDLAFITLDRVFGMQGIFNSCVSVGTSCENLSGDPIHTNTTAYPWPIHFALHSMMTFYSYGIATVSVIIILYFVVVLVTETVMTGTPFGQRANKAWMPVRLIVFFALLAPLGLGGGRNEGVNGAQLITFLAAKYGSNFATNGWDYFNSVLTESYLGNTQNLIARPNIPEMDQLLQFFFVAKMCQAAEVITHGNDIKPYLVRTSLSGANNKPLIATSFADARTFGENKSLFIRFGVMDTSKYGMEKGFVSPFCGELQMDITDAHEPGSLGVMADYYTLLKELWQDAELTRYAHCVVYRTIPGSPSPTCGEIPDGGFAKAASEYYAQKVGTAVDTRIQEQLDNGEWTVPPELLEKGWAGAAIWYNRIAQMNGAVTTAIFNLPRVTKYPQVMEEVSQQHASLDENSSGGERFDPVMRGEKPAEFERANDEYLASAFYTGYSYWNVVGTQAKAPNREKTGISFIDTVNFIYGTAGLFSMRENPDVHPLAQLSAVGKGMIEAAVRNTVIAIVGSFLINKEDGPNIVSGATALAQSAVMITLVLGIMLFYVLPLMPFLYFFFAVSGWIKSIFEAMVAMPLWALAHITRIDGEGLPGPAANNGYFLLFEIFLRPILIVFGMIASISIFSALVMVMNEIFDLVVANVTGFDTVNEAENLGPTQIGFYRSALDEFFFTIVYVSLVYMMGTGCFKMIDQVPNNILRWMGMNVNTFQDGAGNPVGQLTSSMYKGSNVTIGQLAGAGSEISGGKLALLSQTG
mgnify:CR=1 FL=1